MTENMSEKLEQLSAASHEAWQRASRNNALHLGGYSDHAIFDMGWDAAIAHLRSTGHLVVAQADDVERLRTFTKHYADQPCSCGVMRNAITCGPCKARSALAAKGDA